jgi:hypothetical protein
MKQWWPSQAAAGHWPGVPALPGGSAGVGQCREGRTRISQVASANRWSWRTAGLAGGRMLARAPVALPRMPARQQLIVAIVMPRGVAPKPRWHPAGASRPGCPRACPVDLARRSLAPPGGRHGEPPDSGAAAHLANRVIVGRPRCSIHTLSRPRSAGSGRSRHASSASSGCRRRCMSATCCLLYCAWRSSGHYFSQSLLWRMRQGGWRPLGSGWLSVTILRLGLTGRRPAVRPCDLSWVNSVSGLQRFASSMAPSP